MSQQLTSRCYQALEAGLNRQNQGYKVHAPRLNISQATQLTNVVFNMPAFSRGHTGVAMPQDGSGTHMGDLPFKGGAVGINMSNQHQEPQQTPSPLRLPSHPRIPHRHLPLPSSISSTSSAQCRNCCHCCEIDAVYVEEKPVYGAVFMLLWVARVVVEDLWS